MGAAGTGRKQKRGRRGDGLWLDRRYGRRVWCIRYKGLDGKYHRESTQALAREEAAAIRARKMGLIVKAEIAGYTTLERLRPVTFSAFVEETYLPAKAPPARRESTHRRDRNLYAVLKPAFGDVLLARIGVPEIERFFSERKNGRTWKGTPPSPAELNRERTFLYGVMSMAAKHGLVDRNPVESIGRWREDNALDRYLSPEEEGAILLEAPEFVRPIITFALNTAMRLGEIVTLKWSDVDRREGAVVLGGNVRVGVESKGHRARYVPINAAVKAVLDGLTPVALPEGGFSPYVFARPDSGEAYLHGAVYQAFKSAARRAKVEGVCFHTLRHTAVSRMVAAGVPDRIIMQVVGHRSAHMVSRYAHLAPANLRGATDCLAVGKSVPERTMSVL